jgi:hypothetical protein
VISLQIEIITNHSFVCNCLINVVISLQIEIITNF